MASGRALLLLLPSERDGMLKLLEDAKVRAGGVLNKQERVCIYINRRHDRAPRPLSPATPLRPQVPLTQIRPNPAKQQAVTPALQALLSKDQELKVRARLCLHKTACVFT